MPIKVRLQRNNGKFEGEFEILSGSTLDDELKKTLGIESVLISCCVTTMHHDTRTQAKKATRQLMCALAGRLLKESE